VKNLSGSSIGEVVEWVELNSENPPDSESDGSSSGDASVPDETVPSDATEPAEMQ
jgi:hypothetical protein